MQNRQWLCLTLQDPATIIHAALGVLEKVKLLSLPYIRQLFEFRLDGQLFDGSIGDAGDLSCVLMEPHGKHAAQCEGLGFHVKLLTCTPHLSGCSCGLVQPLPPSSQTAAAAAVLAPHCGS